MIMHVIYLKLGFIFFCNEFFLLNKEWIFLELSNKYVILLSSNHPNHEISQGFHKVVQSQINLY
jgi:hypothetical protein